MRHRTELPIALTIAGSDSGGGAGIQADLKTFAALGVHGATVITCVTAQNPKRVLSVQACSPQMVHDQLEAVFAELRPSAVKVGMLYSAPVIRTVADFLSHNHRVPLVVDPVMISTSGTPLLGPAAANALSGSLLPLATLLTPNVQEASHLLARRVESVEDLRIAAKALHKRFGCALLVKGGHLRGLNEAVDIFWDGEQELLLSAPFVRGVKTHGTGCTYSAAVAAYLARGLPMARAVQKAKEYVTQAIAHSRRVGGHFVLGS